MISIKHVLLPATLLVGLIGATASAPLQAQPVERMQYIVQAVDLQTARYAVIRAGGAIANDLRGKQAVNAFLTDEQKDALSAQPGVKVVLFSYAREANNSLTRR